MSEINKLQRMIAWRFLRFFAVALLIGSAAACPRPPKEHAERPYEAIPMIETLPAYGGAPELAAEHFPEQTQALTAALNNYLRNKYRVERARYFALDPDFAGWNAVEKLVGQEITAREPKAHQESFNWHRAGYDSYAVWALNHEWTRHFAVALAPEPLPDGRKLLGYFYLTSPKTQ